MNGLKQKLDTLIDLTQRYFRARVSRDRRKDRGDPGWIIAMSSQPVNNLFAQLVELGVTQEELDQMYKGELKSAFLNEEIGHEATSLTSEDRCWTCKNFNDGEEDETAPLCDVYGELLVVCDHYEEKLDV